MVRIEVKDIVRRLESGRSLTGSKWGAVVMPTLVYSENVNTLGELDDQTLVQNLVWMYSRIVPAFEFDRWLREAQDASVPEEILMSSAYEKVGMFGYVVGVSRTLNFLADNPDKRSTDLPDGEPMGEQLEQDKALVDKAIQLLDELDAESHPRSSDSL